MAFTLSCHKEGYIFLLFFKNRKSQYSLYNVFEAIRQGIFNFIVQKFILGASSPEMPKLLLWKNKRWH
jgi:hypothetical protein